MKYRIVVDADIDFDTDKTTFEVLQPTEQDKLSSEQIAAFLSGALALCIRASKNEAEIMKTVIEYLENEFINPDSFSDLVNKSQS